MTREIPLTKGKVALVDAEDFEKLSKYSWYYEDHGYACRRKTIGYYESNLVYMHREILGEVPRGKVVDHINRNGIDNRRSNLRITEQSMNSANSPPRKGTSKYKGVHYNRSNGRWVAKIEKEGKQSHLGTYKCEENAALAYNKKAVELFGEYAYQNKVSRDWIDWDKEPKFSSGYKGVSLNKSTGRWRSYLRSRNGRIYFGMFGDEESAMRVRDFWMYDIYRDESLLNRKVEVIHFG